jgi:integrase
LTQRGFSLPYNVGNVKNGQLSVYCPYSENTLEDWRGFAPREKPLKLDKMTNGRKHITTREVEKLMAAAKGSRFEARDRCLLLMMFRHGLRVSEACAMQFDQVDIESRVVHVARLKKGLSTTHPLRADELRLIKLWHIERAKMKPSCRTFFVGQHRKPLNRRTACGLRSANTATWRVVNCLRTRTSSATLAASPWPTRALTSG